MVWALMVFQGQPNSSLIHIMQCFAVSTALVVISGFGTGNVASDPGFFLVVFLFGCLHVASNR
jgi:hypothetical protein